MDQAFAVAHERGIRTSAGLHASACLDARDDVGRYAVVRRAVDHSGAVGIAAREVE